MQNNIRRLRQARGWSMEYLADRIGSHFTTIAKLERSERSLSQEWMVKIARALDVEPSDLIDDGKTARPRMVPMLGHIPAGGWREAIADTDDLVMAPAGGPNVFGLRPMGTSMNKVIPENAYVLVDPDQRELLDGKIYAVQNSDNESTLKMYRAEPPRLEPCSTDQAHLPIIFGESPFVVVGRVIWQGMEM